MGSNAASGIYMYVERWRGVGGERVATIRQMCWNMANAAVYVKEIGWGGGGGLATIRCTGTWLMQHQVCGVGEMMVGMGRGT